MVTFRCVWEARTSSAWVGCVEGAGRDVSEQVGFAGRMGRVRRSASQDALPEGGVAEHALRDSGVGACGLTFHSADGWGIVGVNMEVCACRGCARWDQVLEHPVGEKDGALLPVAVGGPAIALLELLPYIGRPGYAEYGWPDVAGARKQDASGATSGRVDYGPVVRQCRGDEFGDV